MSFPGKPREPRPPSRARPRQSLKMQAIGFLSRREYSRQELRAKLLDTLRKRVREDAALEAAADQLARESAEAIRAQPSNGIDDAFVPVPAPTPAAARAPARMATPARAVATLAGAHVRSPDRPALATLSVASGAPLPAALRASLQHATEADTPAPARASGTAPSPANPAATSPLEVDDPEAAVDQLLDWLTANKYLSEARFVESRVNARSRKQGTLRIKMELSRHGLTLEPEQAAGLRESEFARAQALWQRKFGAVAADARERAKQGRFLAARGFSADVVRRIVGGRDED